MVVYAISYSIDRYICSFQLTNINIFHVLRAFFVESLGFATLNVVPLQPKNSKQPRQMVINDYNSINYKANPLQNAWTCCDRFIHEIATCEFDKQGRLLSLYGNVKDAADDLEHREKEAYHTLLDHVQLDLDRLMPIIIRIPETIEEIFRIVPLFGERNYDKYPVVKPEDVPVAREKLEAMELLPLCGNRMAKKTIIDATEFAYIMKDLIIFDLQRIRQSLQNIAKNERMLHNSDKRIERYHRMLKDYQENERESDKLQNRKEWVEHIGQHGRHKESLLAFLSHLEREATNHALGIEAELNEAYLNEAGHVTFIYEHRRKLTPKQLLNHLRFVNDRNQVLQEMELFDLRQPVPGAEADLFVNRAAKELVELLIPAITDRVDFEYSYQYAAWVKAMMDLKLIYPPKNNRMLITNYVNKKFKEKLDKSTLFRYLNKDEGFEKFKKQYELIMQIYDHTQDKRLEFLKKAL